MRLGINEAYSAADRLDKPDTSIARTQVDVFGRCDLELKATYPQEPKIFLSFRQDQLSRIIDQHKEKNDQWKDSGMSGEEWLRAEIANTRGRMERLYRKAKEGVNMKTYERLWHSEKFASVARSYEKISSTYRELTDAEMKAYEDHIVFIKACMTPQQNYSKCADELRVKEMHLDSHVYGKEGLIIGRFIAK